MRSRLKAALAVGITAIAIVVTAAVLVPGAEPEPAQASFSDCVLDLYQSSRRRPPVASWFKQQFIYNVNITLHCAFFD